MHKAGDQRLCLSEDSFANGPPSPAPDVTCFATGSARSTERARRAEQASQLGAVGSASSRLSRTAADRSQAAAFGGKGSTSHPSCASSRLRCLVRGRPSRNSSKAAVRGSASGAPQRAHASLISSLTLARALSQSEAPAGETSSSTVASASAREPRRSGEISSSSRRLSGAEYETLHGGLSQARSERRSSIAGRLLFGAAGGRAVRVSWLSRHALASRRLILGVLLRCQTRLWRDEGVRNTGRWAPPSLARSERLCSPCLQRTGAHLPAADCPAESS